MYLVLPLFVFTMHLAGMMFITIAGVSLIGEIQDSYPVENPQWILIVVATVMTIAVAYWSAWLFVRGASQFLARVRKSK